MEYFHIHHTKIYGMRTVKISESMRVAMQKFASKCLRCISESGAKDTQNRENWEKEHETNETIRRRYGIPACATEIYGGNYATRTNGGKRKQVRFLNNQTE